MQSTSSSTDSDGLLTEAQAADYLKLSIRTLQSWRIKKVGPAFVRAGRAIRYRRYDLLVWIKLQTIESSQSAAARHG